MAAAADALETRIAEVRQKIAAAVRKSGRTAESVRLVAVSKTHPAAVVSQAIELGLTDFGESRVQEAEDKIATVGLPKCSLAPDRTLASQQGSTGSQSL